METIFQEYSSYQGTLVKPYYWLYSNQSCSKCPYHIRTGEESRVTYKEFYETFGFPYGPTMQENKQLLFYEIKAFNGALIQRGQVTNCTISDIHAESFLFEKQGYLDSLLCLHDSISYITLYANFTPCNEYNHYCISKIYDLLIRYPQMRLDIYFSQMYHTEENFSSAPWNREALKSIAGHWPRVTVNPLSDGIWRTVLYTFVKEVPEAAMNQPILPVRASVDNYNAYMIYIITGIKPYFVEDPPLPQPKEKPEYQREKMKYNVVPLPPSGFPHYAPFLVPSMSFASTFPNQKELMTKPKQVVRHLNMPADFSEERHLNEVIPNTKKVNQVVIITEQEEREKRKEKDNQRRKRKK
ncbi:putative C-_U-editing enzyme APOBEC-4 [Hyperolius riggenbachi]|uniref:putative C->U-editing enzyme APOBEC-4 n=1 Tax=Hyperolius riggenbachi TaxID=752182 RepID=UPI0035A3A621